ncbi:nucleoporin Nup186/Nup192/Nup205 [Pilobolus umbonatus]|nr:nucleoporin Nup186/Nup192/Nup205 [Pilobolus umbonatus]
MSSYSIPTWAEDMRVLFDFICQTRVSSTAADSLQHQLQLNKQRFIALLDYPKKDASHRHSLKTTKKTYINRTTHNVTEDFIEKTLFISDQLDIDEYISSTLLMHGVNKCSRISSNSVDTAVILYYDERSYLLACLDVILKTIQDASVSMEIREVCRQFMAEIMRERLVIDNQSASFVTKLLHTLYSITKAINAIQNTGSVTGVVPTVGSGKLGDVNNIRIDRLGDERVYIVQIMYHLASLFNIEADDKLEMLKLLEQAELTDLATPYAILTMIASLSNYHQSEEKSPSRETIDFIDRFHNRIMTHGSTIPVIKATVVLQWILYLKDPIRAQAVVGSSNRDRNDSDIQQLLEAAIQTDVFRFINYYLLYFQHSDGPIDSEIKSLKAITISEEPKVIDQTNYKNIKADIRIDFHRFVIYEVEKLTTQFIVTQFDVLQKLKYKEEDTYVPLQSPMSSETALVADSENGKDQCRDLEYFLTLLANVYRERVDAGNKFWSKESDGINFFVRWLLDIKINPTVSAAFDFLGTIATGDMGANSLFALFEVGTEADMASSTLFSWGKPFAALEFYIDQLKSNEGQDCSIPAAEESILLKFLYALKQTVQYSCEARKLFWDGNNRRYRNILIHLLGCPTSIYLRAAIFNVLAAFCSSWGGGVNGLGAEISCRVWCVLDDSDMLRLKSQIDDNKVQAQYSARSANLLREIQYKKTQKLFTETLAIVQLIGSAIHTKNKREILISGFTITHSSIPAINQGSQTMGTIPFISFVVDDVFDSLRSQEYKHSDSRWQLTEACLIVMENSVESFDLDIFDNKTTREQLEAAIEHNSDRKKAEEFLLAYLVHPGFQVLMRILSGGRVINELFDVIQQCACKETKETEYMIYRKRCLIHALRILQRVLDIQGIFCNILIPYVIGFSKRKETSEFQLRGITFPPLPSVVLLGQLILFKTGMLTQIAMLINYEDQEEVCLLSTRILHKLSVDPKVIQNRPSRTFSYVASAGPPHGMSTSLACLLNSSKAAESIIFGVSERFSINFPEVITCDDYEYDINNIPFWLASETLKNEYNYPTEYKPRVESSVRLAIVDALIDNAQSKTSSPSLTEFLLGYHPSKDGSSNVIQDTETNKGRVVCFHSILDMMRQGIEKDAFFVDDMIEDTDQHNLTLIDTHPILAEKCYELIYRLCAKKALSASTMRYLRNRENFFYKQFDAMSARLEDNIEDDSTSFGGVMVCADGSRVATDFFKLRSKLHQRGWFLQSLALELHSIANTGQKNHAHQLLELLYGVNRVNTDRGSHNDMDTSDYQENLFSASACNGFEQPLIKIFELISSLEFIWEDNLLENMKVDVQYLNAFNPQTFLITNGRGCEVYDIRRIFKELRKKQQDMMIADELINVQMVESEIGYILAWAITENHKREIQFGKIHCLKAWKQVIHVTLLECFDMMSVETRERITFKLLTMLLSKVVQVKDIDVDLLKGMSEIILALLNRLRKDKQTRPTSQLPVEDLRNIFSGILDCIRQTSSTIVVRGDLYSAITSFLLYLKGHDKDETCKNLEKYIIEQIALYDYSLLDKICTDAIDGLDIWKTTAFIALDSLNTVSLQAGMPVVQPFLINKNYLQYFIDMIRSDDAALSNIIEQIDAPLLPLYIFESKLSILLTLAMNSEGAQLLLNHQIFEILGQCQFMKAHQQDLSVIQMSVDSSIELAERANQLLLPTLKLIVAILTTFGKKNNMVLLKAEGWVRRQQSVLVSILREDERLNTLLSLEKLRLATTIIYYISCRKGYSNDLFKRGINQLHNSILHLHIADDLASKIIPNTTEEKAWDSTPNQVGSSSSILETKALKLIKAIQNNVSAYKVQSVDTQVKKNE